MDKSPGEADNGAVEDVNPSRTPTKYMLVEVDN